VAFLRPAVELVLKERRETFEPVPVLTAGHETCSARACAATKSHEMVGAWAVVVRT
jgi:hypothetical protein